MRGMCRHSTIIITQASHHFWTHPPLPTDSIYIQEARAKQALVVEAWLNTPYDG